MATQQKKPDKTNNTKTKDIVSKNGKVMHALQNHVDTFLSLFGISQDPTILLTLEEQVVYVNPAFEETFGWKLEELAGNQIDFIPPDCVSENIDAIISLVNDGKITGFTTKRLTKNGNILDVEASGTLLQDDEDNVVGSIIIYRTIEDLTAQFQADDALVETLVDQERAASQLERVAKVSTAVSTILDPQEMLQAVVDLTKENFDFYHAHIYLLNQAGDTLELAAGAGEVGRQMVKEKRQILLSKEKSVVARAARIRSGINIKDTQKETSFLPHPLLPKTRSELAVPLIVGEQLLGVLDVQSETVAYFTQRDANILTTLAAQVAAALQNARLFEQSERQAQRLRLLNEMSNALNAVENMDEALNVISRYSLDILGGDRASLYLYDDQNETLEMLSLSGLEGTVLSKTIFSTDETVLGIVVKENRLIHLPEDMAFEDNPDTKSLADKFGIKSSILGPLAMGDKIIGSLNMSSKTANTYGPAEINLMQQVSAVVASTLQVRQLFEQAEERAIELAAVADLSTAVSTILDPLEMLQAVVDLTQERFNLYHTHIYLLNEDGKTLELAVGAGEVGRQMVEEKRQIPLSKKKSLVARAARSRTGVNIKDVKEEPGFLPHPLLLDTRSELAVPMILGDQLLGILDVQSEITDRFSEKDVIIQTTLATQVAVALQNARQFVQTQESEEKYRTIIENMEDGYFEVDFKGTFTFVNDQVSKMIGYPYEELIGLNYRAYMEEEMAQKVFKAFNHIFETGEPEKSFDYEIIHKDGHILKMNSSVGLIRDPKGQPIGFRGIMRDVTKRLEAQEELQKFKLGIERSTSAVFMTDPGGEIIYVNPAFTEIYGFSAEEAIGQTPRILKSGLIPQEQYKYFWQTLLNKEVVSGEIVNKTRAGQLIPIEGYNNPIINEAGEIIGFLGVHNDITERKKAETDLEAALAESEQLYEMSTRLNKTSSIAEIIEAAVVPVVADDLVSGNLFSLELDKNGRPEWMTMISDWTLLDRESLPAVVPVGTRLQLTDVPSSQQWIDNPHEVLLYGDVENDDTLDEAAKGYYQTAGIKASATLPLQVGNEWVGLLTLSWQETKTFTADDARLYRSLAEQTAIILKNQLLFEQAQQRADELHQSEQTVQQTLKMQQILHEVSLDLAQAESVEELYQQVIRLGRDKLNFERIGLYLFDKENHRFTGTFGIDDKGQIINERDDVFDIVEEGLANYMNIKQRVIVELDTDLYQAGEPIGRGWHLTVPLRREKELIGALFADHLLSHRPLKPYEPDLLASYGNTVVTLLDRKQAEAALRSSEQVVQESLRKQRILHEIGLELASIPSLDELFKQVIILARDRLNFERIGFFLYKPESKKYIGTYGVDLDGNLRDESDPIFEIAEDDITEFHKGFDLKNRIIVKHDTDMYDAGEVVGRGWLLSSPVHVNNEFTGLLFAENMRSHRPLEPYEPDLLASYTNLIGNLIERRQASEALEISEQHALEFQEKLKLLNEIDHQLSQAENLDALYRLAIEKGREHLGFDRMALFMVVENSDHLQGTYGTDAAGNITDEHHIFIDRDDVMTREMVAVGRDYRQVSEDIELYSLEKPIGRGWHINTFLWSQEEEPIGRLVADGFLKGEPMKPFQPELLTLYAATIAHQIIRQQVNIALAEALADTERLYEMSRRMSATSTMEEIIQAAILPVLDHRVAAANLFRLELDENGRPEWMEMTANWVHPESTLGGTDVPIGTRFYLPDIPSAAQWIEHPDDISLYSDVETDETIDETTHGLYQMTGVKSTANLPLRSGNEWVGLLTFSWDSQHQFASEDARLYRSLAEQTAVMLKNQILFNQTQRRATELATVAEVGAAIAVIRNVDELLDQAVNMVKDHFNLYHTQIYLLDAINESLVLASGAGKVGQQMVSETSAIMLGQEPSLIAQAARMQQTIIVNDVSQHPDYVVQPHLPDTRSEMIIPIFVADELLGILDIHADKINHFSEDEIRINNTLAAQIGVALQNAQSFTRSEEALHELEEMTRKLRREGWESYLESSFVTDLGFQFDQKRITPIQVKKSRRRKSKKKEADSTASLAKPLLVQGEPIGNLVLSEPESLQDEAADIMTAVAERLSEHIENLRLTEQTQRALSETEIQAHRLVILNEISTELSNAADLAELYQIAVERIAKLLNADRVSLPLLLSDGEHIEVAAHFGEEMGAPTGTVLRLADTNMAIAFKENRLIAGTPSGNILSTRIAPLSVRGQFIGTLNIGSYKEEFFDERDESLLLQMATILSSIIENKQLLGAAQTRAQREQRLREIAAKVRSSSDVDTIMRTAVQEIGQALGRQTFVQLGSEINGTAEEDA